MCTLALALALSCIPNLWMIPNSSDRWMIRYVYNVRHMISVCYDDVA